MPAGIEALYVQLPGRESRLREPSLSSVSNVADAATDAIVPLLDKPFVLFGHSLGGLIAFEVARVLRRRGLRAPARLFASACRAPHLRYPFPPLHQLDEGQLLRRLNARYDGSVPREVMESPELRELLVPALRADLTALETYQHAAELPLECPITVYGGREDRTVSRGELEAWSFHTTEEVRVEWVEGAHFYLQTARARLIDDIALELERVLAAQCAGGRA
jgi:surfactin synthase thioesterase subunit